MVLMVGCGNSLISANSSYEDVSVLKMTQKETKTATVTSQVFNCQVWGLLATKLGRVNDVMLVFVQQVYDYQQRGCFSAFYSPLSANIG